MKTYTECIPCFFKQALEAGKIAGADDKTQKDIFNKLAAALTKFSLDRTPPEIGRDIYSIVRKQTKVNDPYIKIKRKSNSQALKIYEHLKNKAARSKDGLLTAVELAIAGNIIDYGIKGALDLDKEINLILNEENRAIKHESGKLFDYKNFKKALGKARKILYIGDNAGEIVFDRVLIEEIKRIYPEKEIVYAVKENPVINDVLFEDAYTCKIDKLARIVSSGMDAPGTMLSLCSDEFKKLFENSDIIISKGQGNYEALSEQKGPIFFLFMAKCLPVAKHLKCRLRDIILLKGDA